MTETLNIYRDRKVIFEAPVTKAAKRSRTLMGDNYVSLAFSTAREFAPVFEIGDYIEIDDKKFYINERTTPAYNSSTSGYDYTLKFVSEDRTWKNYKVKSLKTTSTGGYVFGETKWSSTATLRDHAANILRVLQLHAGLRVVDSDILSRVHVDEDFFTDSRDKDHKTASYDGTDILAALDSLCSANMFDCEWWAEISTAGPELFFGRLGRNGAAALTIETGVDGTISREQSRTPYANRIYVYGGTKNVPYTYRKHLVFTNTRQDGRLADDRRELEPKMIRGAVRDPQYTFMQPAETRYENSRLRTTEKYNIVASAGASVNLEKGDYKLYLSKILYTAEIESVAGVIESIEIRLFTLENNGKLEQKVLSLIEPREKSVSTNLGEDVVFSFSGNSALKVWIEVDVIAERANEAIVLKTSLKSNHTERLNAVLERVCKYTAGVSLKNIITGEKFGGSWTRTETDEYITIPEGKEAQQYEIAEIIPVMIPNSYYTSDYGEDVINGLSETRLLLPDEISDEYVCRDGYIQPTRLSGPVVEAVVTHDEIYPLIASMPIEDVDDTQKATASLVLPDQSVSEREYKVFYVKAQMTGSDGVKYDFKRDYILDGQKLQAKFISGKLSGLTFDVMFEEDDREQYYLIVPNSEYGTLLPNDTLRPEIGDEILLIGWNPNALPDLGLINEAERRLYAAAQDEIEKALNGDSSYKVTMYPETIREADAGLTDADGNDLIDINGNELTCIIYEDVPTLEIGDAVKLLDHAIFGTAADGSPNGSGNLRVIGYDIPLDVGWDSPQYTIGEIPKPSRLKTLETKTK